MAAHQEAFLLLFLWISWGPQCLEMHSDRNPKFSSLLVNIRRFILKLPSNTLTQAIGGLRPAPVKEAQTPTTLQVWAGPS